MSLHCESLSSSEPPSSSSSSSCLLSVYRPYQRRSSNVKLQSFLQLGQFQFLDLLFSSIVTTSVSIATKIEVPAVAIQQTCGDFDALHQSIMQSTHTLDVHLKMSLQQLPNIYTKQLKCYNSYTVSRVLIHESVPWICAFV